MIVLVAGAAIAILALSIWLIIAPWLTRIRTLSYGEGAPLLLLPEPGDDPRKLLKKLSRAMPHHRLLAPSDTAFALQRSAERILRHEGAALDIVVAQDQAARAALRVAGGKEHRLKALVLIDPPDVKLGEPDTLFPPTVILTRKKPRCPALLAALPTKEHIAAPRITPELIAQAVARAEAMAGEVG